MNDTARGDADLQALAAIDPAGPRDQGAHRSPAAQALLASITTDPAPRIRSLRDDTPHSSDGPHEPARTRRTGRWVWAAAAAVVVGVGITVASSPFGDDAYAGWTDVPAAATASDAQAAEDDCRDMWLDIAETPGEGNPGPDVVADADRVLAEQRGDFTYTVLSDGSWAMDCLVQTRTHPLWGAGAGAAAGLLQPLGDSGELAPDGIADLRVAGMGGDDIDGIVLMLYGRVGPEVTAVVVHTPDVGDVEATVTNGFVAAWAPALPEHAFDGPAIAMTLYLSDGSEVHLTPEDVWAANLANLGI